MTYLMSGALGGYLTLLNRDSSQLRAPGGHLLDQNEARCASSRERPRSSQGAANQFPTHLTPSCVAHQIRSPVILDDHQNCSPLIATERDKQVQGWLLHTLLVLESHDKRPKATFARLELKPPKALTSEDLMEVTTGPGSGQTTPCQCAGRVWADGYQCATPVPTQTQK